MCHTIKKGSQCEKWVTVWKMGHSAKWVTVCKIGHTVKKGSNYQGNKISYFLTYHSFVFYISKVLNVTVISYFLHSFSFSPRRRFVFQIEISGKYILLVLISRQCGFTSLPLFAVGISLPFSVYQKWVTLLTNVSQYEKWITMLKICHTLRNVSRCEKLSHSVKKGSQCPKWVYCKKWVTVCKRRHSVQNGSHCEKCTKL